MYPGLCDTSMMRHDGRTHFDFGLPCVLPRQAFRVELPHRSKTYLISWMAIHALLTWEFPHTSGSFPKVHGAE
ncbi:hypothetical protein P8C59_004020 [Phyllachora maydis]|uniref:Uncharacterized protein n=1 Tax=Phyllachora maydis TaxID=1825666 RepID=A0AAD9MD11_9PEZI|nr:hypothetical protein P8C59_004020 [Phyllachora maydis]